MNNEVKKTEAGKPNRFAIGFVKVIKAIFVKNIALKGVALLLGVVTFILLNIL